MKGRDVLLQNNRYIDDIKGHISNIQQEIYSIHSLLSQYRNFLLKQLEIKNIGKKKYNEMYMTIKFTENMLLTISSFLMKIIERLKKNE